MLINEKYCYNELPKMSSFAISLPNFLKEEFAESCYNDLRYNMIFEDHIYGNLTNILTAKKEIRKAYSKDFIRKKAVIKNKYNPDDVYEMFESKEFISIISQIVGEEIFFLRPPNPYKFKEGTHLCLHDDMSHPQNAYEIVINFTKNWKKNMVVLQLEVISKVAKFPVHQMNSHFIYKNLY